MIKKFIKNSERGQVIILIAFAITGMIAIVGLMTDGGILLVEYARLKRGIDAASVAAALQFRQGFQSADLEAAAEEFLRLNESNVSTVAIDTCDTLPGDTTLCTTPRRKLVRVTASQIVEFGFMRIIGINSTTITATSIGEAASIDLVMIIDTSASMAFETTGSASVSDPGDDPSLCNANGFDGYCMPMQTVKGVAEDFIDTMFFPYDRVALVTMTSQNDDGFRDPYTPLHLEDDKATVVNAIQNIKVYEPPACDSLYGVCRDLCTQNEIDLANAAGDPDNPCYGRTEGYYVGQACPVYSNITPNNPASCNSSNVGGALLMAGAEFGIEPVREDSFWVVIALVGGPANATDPTASPPNLTDVFAPLGYPDNPEEAFGYCPSNTWASPTNPFCRDASAATRHAVGDVNYDADDYARDSADFLTNPVTGQGVTVFTIGLGSLIRNSSKGDADAGEQLLTYIARTAGDGPGVQASHGDYFFSPDAAGLAAIFASIAENIFTRISQ